MDKIDINKIFEFKTVYIIISEDNFNKRVFELIANLKNKKVCYVTLNKGADFFIEFLKNNKIGYKNLFFIDGITKTLTTPLPQPNCVFISSPNAITELSIAINNCIDSDFSVVIVDSLFTLMVYHNLDVIKNFIQKISDKIKPKNGNLILLLPSKYKNSKVFEKIGFSIDKTIEFE